ncbi:MAG: hypothetical protein M5U34_35750 [Chloroflexi bacterium]|nr:hypothetical protein [Chloroflexota bacterium]
MMKIRGRARGGYCGPGANPGGGQAQAILGELLEDPDHEDIAELIEEPSKKCSSLAAK